MAEKDRDIHLDLGLGGLFKGLANFLELVEKMDQEGQTEISRTGKIKGPGKGTQGIYGFNVRLGLGGKPVIEPFGNVHAGEAGPTMDEVREPIVDVFDEEHRVLIIAELPGIEEESLTLDLQDDRLTIYGAGKNRVYRKEVTLPAPVDPASRSSSYRNGVLEVEFRKKGA